MALSATHAPSSPQAPDAHSESSRHVRHTFASQIGAAVGQSVLAAHSIHTPELVLQTGVGETQSPFATHCTQPPELVLQTGASAKREHSAESVHGSQTSVVTLQTGAAAAQPASTAARHLTLMVDARETRRAVTHLGDADLVTVSLIQAADGRVGPRAAGSNDKSGGERQRQQFHPSPSKATSHHASGIGRVVTQVRARVAQVAQPDWGLGSSPVHGGTGAPRDN